MNTYNILVCYQEREDKLDHQQSLLSNNQGDMSYNIKQDSMSFIHTRSPNMQSIKYVYWYRQIINQGDTYAIRGCNFSGAHYLDGNYSSDVLNIISSMIRQPPREI
jgi:hypothetical protein